MFDDILDIFDRDRRAADRYRKPGAGGLLRRQVGGDQEHDTRPHRRDPHGDWYDGDWEPRRPARHGRADDWD